jgi:hypothetical protein
MAILKSGSFETHHDIFVPLARLLAVSSADSDDLVNLWKFYETIFYEPSDRQQCALVTSVKKIFYALNAYI